MKIPLARMFSDRKDCAEFAVDASCKNVVIRAPRACVGAADGQRCGMCKALSQSMASTNFQAKMDRPIRTGMHITTNSVQLMGPEKTADLQCSIIPDNGQEEEFINLPTSEEADAPVRHEESISNDTGGVDINPSHLGLVRTLAADEELNVLCRNSGVPISVIDKLLSTIQGEFSSKRLSVGRTIPKSKSTLDQLQQMFPGVAASTMVHVPLETVSLKNQLKNNPSFAPSPRIPVFDFVGGWIGSEDWTIQTEVNN